MRQVVYGTQTECREKMKRAVSQHGNKLKWFKASRTEHKEHAKMLGFDMKKNTVSYWANDFGY